MFSHSQDMLPVLTELQRSLDMQSMLESLVEEGNYWKVGLRICCNMQIAVKLLTRTQPSYNIFSLFLANPSSDMFIFMLIIMQAFQVLSEYLQLLDSLSELSAIQEMSRGVEVNIEQQKIKHDILLKRCYIRKIFLAYL